MPRFSGYRRQVIDAKVGEPCETSPTLAYFGNFTVSRDCGEAYSANWIVYPRFLSTMLKFLLLSNTPEIK